MKYDFKSNSEKKFPMLIVLENTNVCNLRCIHCPIGNGWTETPHYKPTYMKWNTYKKVIDEISEYEIQQLIFSPEGENLVHPQFIDQLNYAKRKKIERITIKSIWESQEYNDLRKCHQKGDFKSGQSICEACTDWRGMRWDWGYEKALDALRGDKTIPEYIVP